MPATLADIDGATRDAAVVSWTDTAITARYPSARDGSLSPAMGYFDSQADALTVLNARGVLIGKEARRFAVGVNHVILPTISTAAPCFALTDSEQVAGSTMIAARIEVDLDAETTTIELFGAAGA